MTSYFQRSVLLFLFVVGLTVPPAVNNQPSGTVVPLLISAETGMETAWDIPRNPLTDSLPTNKRVAQSILRGFQIFMNTPAAAPRLVGNRLSCNNCHLNGGQREKAMPLVGVAAVYPEYNKRSGRLFSLEDRIVGCFLRSQNATGVIPRLQTRGSSVENDSTGLSTRSEEVLALSAYINWLSSGFPIGQSAPWRGQNQIAEESILPLSELNPKRGEELFLEKCSSCHGEDGQGAEIGDKIAGPLWGSKSWNDGAGAARVYTLAGIIRYAMPYLDPGSLTDEEAQHIAAYINSKPRPKFPYKQFDYPSDPVPSDAVYYRR